MSEQQGNAYVESRKKAVACLSSAFRMLDSAESVKSTDLVWNWASERWASFDAANPMLDAGANAGDYHRPIARLRETSTDRLPEQTAPISETYFDEVLANEAKNFDDQLDALENVYMLRILHAGLGLTTEVGELMDNIKKHLIYGKPFDVINAKEEAGDILWYLAVYCNALGMTNFDEAMNLNIQKLKARYSKGFTPEEALTRNIDKEMEVFQSPAAGIPIFEDTITPSDIEVKDFVPDEDELMAPIDLHKTAIEQLKADGIEPTITPDEVETEDLGQVGFDASLMEEIASMPPETFRKAYDAEWVDEFTKDDDGPDSPTAEDEGGQR